MSILITRVIAIFTLEITRYKFAQWIPVRSVLTQFSGGFAWTDPMPFCYTGYIS